MASTVSRSSCVSNPDFQTVIRADQSKIFGKVYVAIHNYMLKNPDEGFQAVETLLRTSGCVSKLLAYKTPVGATEGSEWPAGEEQKYQLFVSVVEDNKQVTHWMRKFGSSSYQENYEKLDACGFSVFWLRNHVRLMKLIVSPVAQVLKCMQEVSDQTSSHSECTPRAVADLRNARDVCHEALGITIEQIFFAYSPSQGPILEMGSVGTSLAAHLPRDIQRRISDSDISGKTYGCVAMNDVLNTISKERMRSIVEEVWSKLDPGGFLLHFSLGSPLFEDCIQQFPEAEFIDFPILNPDGSLKGIYVAKKEAFCASVAIMRPEYSNLQKAFQAYMLLSRARRLELFNELDDFSEFHLLSDAFLALKCPGTQSVYFDQYRFSAMDAVLREKGFEIKRCREEATLYIGPRTKEHRALFPLNNHFSIEGIDFKVGSLRHLDRSDSVRQEALIHVIAAQKPL